MRAVRPSSLHNSVALELHFPISNLSEANSDHGSSARASPSGPQRATKTILRHCGLGFLALSKQDHETEATYHVSRSLAEDPSSQAALVAGDIVRDKPLHKSTSRSLRTALR